MKLYIAGPLFTCAEREFNQRLGKLLTDKGYTVFLPQDFAPGTPEDKDFFANTFKACIDYLDQADVVVAIADGADADSGTCFEMGYAYAKGMPILCVRTDFRISEEDGLNLMLTQSASGYIQDFSGGVQDVGEAVANWLENYQSYPEEPPSEERSP
ncbi:MAG: nucleoside 2-deoxyribosyltransferase [Cyanobacteria bacterium P01_C01_bin.89]